MTHWSEESNDSTPIFCIDLAAAERGPGPGTPILTSVISVTGISCFIGSLRAPSGGRAKPDLLFQIISQRYERGPIVITSNRAYKSWPEIFNNDSTLTSALLDRLLHHAETIVIEGKSFRMKDQNEN